MAQNETSVKLRLLLDQTDFNTGMNTSIKNVAKLGAGLAGLAGGTKIITDLTSSVVELGMEFDQSFAKVTTLFGDVAVNTDMLQDSILDLSSATGIAASELNEGLYQALSAGIPVTEDMSDAMNFLEQATMLSVAGFTDLPSAVDIATTAINAFGYDVADTDKIMNMFIETQNAGKTTVDELAQSLGKAIPPTNLLGLELEDLLSVLAIMTANGFGTAEAVTAVSTAFTNLNLSSSLVNNKFKEFTGQTIPEFISEGHNIVDVINEINKMMEEQNLTMEDISNNKYVTSTLSTLLNHSEELAETYDRLTDETYELKDGYEAMQTPVQNVAKIQESWNNMLIEFWEKIGPGVNEVLSFIADNMNILGPIILSLTLSLGFLAVAFGVATVGGLLFELILSPIILVAGAVVLALAGLILALQVFSEQISVVVSNVTTALDLISGDVMTFISLTAKSWSDFWTTFREDPQKALAGIQQDLETFFDLLIQNLASFGKLLLQNIQTFFSNITIGDGAIQDNLETFFGLLLQNFQTFGEQFLANLETFGGLVSQNFGTFIELASDSWSDFWATFSENPIEAFNNLYGDIQTFFLLVLQNFGTFGELLMQNIGTFFLELGANIKTGVVLLFQNLQTILGDALTYIKENFGELTQAFLQGVERFFEDLGNLIMQGIAGFINFLADFISYVANHIDEMIEWLITTALPALVGAFIVILTLLITTAFSAIVGLVKAFIQNLPALGASILNLIGSFGDMVIGIFDGIVDGVQNLWTNLWSAIIPDAIWAGLVPINDGLMALLDNVQEIFGGIIDFIVGVFTGDWERAWQGVKNIFDGLWKAMANTLISAVNTMISALNGLFSGINNFAILVPEGIPGIGGTGWDPQVPLIPSVPYFAKGGVVDGATFGVVGEAGPEMILPLNQQGASFISSLLGNLQPSQGQNVVFENTINITGVQTQDDLLKQLDYRLGKLINKKGLV